MNWGLCRLLFGWQFGILVAVILVYGDDAWDEKQERVCAVAGVVGTIPAWRAVEREWLVRTNGIPFHAKDCDSDHGDYENNPHDENKELYRDLSIMVVQSHVHGIGVAIDLIALHDIFPDAQDISYYRAFLRVMEVMNNFAKKNAEIAEFTFDMRLESEHNAGLLYGIVRENEPEWAPYLADKVSFEFSRKNPRLQVADLIAHEAMKGMDNMVGPVKRIERRSWTALRETRRFFIEGYSRDWFTDLKRNYAELGKKVGFCQQDYIDWLAKRKRQHNVTNLILFMDWIAKRDASTENGEP
jgi:hypothetical protein